MRKIQVVILTNGWVKDNVKNLDILYGGLTMAYFKEALFFGIFLIDICEILCEVRIWNLWDKFQCIGSGQIGQFRRVPPQFFLGLATHTKCTYSMQKFLAWNCYHFCWVKNIIMMSFRHILFWVFCTVQKLHTTRIPIPIDLVHFSETPKNFYSTDNGQTPSIFLKLPKIGRHERQKDTVPFLEAPKNRTARTMDRLRQFLWKLPKIGQKRWWTLPIDLLHFLETPKNWTARTIDRLRPFFGSSQK
jgi:hypothetical protein